MSAEPDRGPPQSHPPAFDRTQQRRRDVLLGFALVAATIPSSIGAAVLAARMPEREGYLLTGAGISCFVLVLCAGFVAVRTMKRHGGPLISSLLTLFFAIFSLSMTIGMIYAAKMR